MLMHPGMMIMMTMRAVMAKIIVSSLMVSTRSLRMLTMLAWSASITLFQIIRISSRAFMASSSPMIAFVVATGVAPVVSFFSLFHLLASVSTSAYHPKRGCIYYVYIQKFCVPNPPLIYLIKMGAFLARWLWRCLTNRHSSLTFHI